MHTISIHMLCSAGHIRNNGFLRIVQHICLTGELRLGLGEQRIRNRRSTFFIDTRGRTVGGNQCICNRRIHSLNVGNCDNQFLALYSSCKVVTVYLAAIQQILLAIIEAGYGNGIVLYILLNICSRKNLGIIGKNPVTIPISASVGIRLNRNLRGICQGKSIVKNITQLRIGIQLNCCCANAGFDLPKDIRQVSSLAADFVIPIVFTFSKARICSGIGIIAGNGIQIGIGCVRNIRRIRSIKQSHRINDCTFVLHGLGGRNCTIRNIALKLVAISRFAIRKEDYGCITVAAVGEDTACHFHTLVSGSCAARNQCVNLAVQSRNSFGGYRRQPRNSLSIIVSVASVLVCVIPNRIHCGFGRKFHDCDTVLLVSIRNTGILRSYAIDKGFDRFL